LSVKTVAMAPVLVMPGLAAREESALMSLLSESSSQVGHVQMLWIEKSSQGLPQSRSVIWRTCEVIYVVDSFSVVVSQEFHFASALGGLSGAFCR
jgi:hypothetical protein